VKLTEVIILDQIGGKWCPEGCGVDWLKEENRNLARESIKQRFGDRVRIDFFDLQDPSIKQRFPQLVEKIKEESLYLPILLINGEVRISGYFDFRMLLDMVEAEGELTREGI
jgi:disulfide oxidoreductase YuzD